MKTLKPVLVAFLLVLVIVVVFQNTDTVETKLLFTTIAMPSALLLLLTLLVGVVFGIVLGVTMPRRPKRKE